MRFVSDVEGRTLREAAMREALEWALDTLEADDEVLGAPVPGEMTVYAIKANGKTVTMARSTQYADSLARARAALRARTEAPPATKSDAISNGLAPTPATPDEAREPSTEAGRRLDRWIATAVVTTDKARAAHRADILRVEAEARADCVDEATEVKRRQDAVAEARAELLDALWQCGVQSGMDTDGDDGPGAMVAGMGVAGFAAAMVGQVERLRADYESALAEPPAAALTALAARLTPPEDPDER